MAATNKNKTVCKELMENSHIDDLYRLRKGVYPTGVWGVKGICNDMTIISKRIRIGQYDIDTDIRVDCAYAMLTTNTYYFSAIGEIICHNRVNYNFIGDEVDSVRCFVDKVVKERAE